MRYFVVFFFVLSSNTFFSQKKMKESYIDSMSLVYYSSSDIISLRYLVNQSINQGNDFYYLRLRLGLLYFGIGNYAHAIYHLEKALNFYPADLYSKDKLFFAYLYLNDVSSARLIASKFPLSDRSFYLGLLGNHNLLVIESGFQWVNPSALFTDRNAFLTSDGLYAESDRLSQVVYNQVGLGYQLGKRCSFYHGITYIQNKRKQYISYSQNSISFDSLVHYGVKQYQLYTGVNIQCNKGLLIQLGGNLFSYHATKNSVSFDTASKVYKYDILKLNQSNYLATFGISKTVRKWTSSLSLSSAYIDSSFFLQFGSQLTCNVFGDGSFLVSSGFAYSKSDSQNRMVYNIKTGFLIGKKSWVDLYYLGGDLTNFCDGNGYVIFNISDKLITKTGFNIQYPFTSFFSAALRYDLMRRESLINRYNPVLSSSSELILNQSLITTLTWKF
jgi:hypothetical protein